MSSIQIQLKGLEGIISRVKNLSKEAAKEVEAEFQAFGFDTERDAKALAPTDEGHLRSSISSVTTMTGSKITTEIVVATDYAAYVEFGTRKFAAVYVGTLPEDWVAFAAQYRGPGGGTLAEMLKRLQAWVLRKGFAAEKTKSGNASKSKTSLKKQEQAAYEIAIHILLNGIKPHPFLYPSVEKNKKLLIDNLNRLFPAK
jgi:HK97 gp10 family phage protein